MTRRANRVIVCFLLIWTSAYGQQSPAPAPIVPPPAQQEVGPGAQEPPLQEVPVTSAPLRVMVGKSLLINTAERLRRVSVTDPAVADAIVVTPTQILVHGRAAG